MTDKIKTLAYLGQVYVQELIHDQESCDKFTGMTTTQIASAIGVSVPTASANMKELLALGYVDMDEVQHRKNSTKYMWTISSLGIEYYFTYRTPKNSELIWEYVRNNHKARIERKMRKDFGLDYEQLKWE